MNNKSQSTALNKTLKSFKSDVMRTLAVRCSIGAETAAIGDEFEDVSTSGPFDGSDQANPAIARNLRRLAALLYLLGNRIEHADGHIDVTSILGLAVVLKYYRKTLPKLLCDQLDEALGWLPYGLIWDKRLFKHAAHILPCAKSDGVPKTKESAQR